ncbi:LPS-assembly protein LptD OS=Rhodanobacter lindaniclasticus OX=75310 GN=lptD PE=3 SV=1 [Rhodanobacter lindaniclasticus]
MCRPNALLDFYDPTLGRDSSLRATTPARVAAQHVDSSDQSVYHLSGNVLLQRADQQLQADTLDYNDATTDYDARGNVRYQEAGQLLAASHLRGNTDASRGVADDVRYQMLSSRGNGVAKQGHMLDAERTRYSMATYSTCDVGHHVWEFRAKSISIDKASGVGVARDATMRIGKVPFLYLPYFTFPTDDRRKSGFLYPTLGNTSRAGFQVSTPYYLNLAPNYDATLDPRYYSRRGPLLAGEFRYLVPGSRGQLNVEYVPDDRGESDGLANTHGKSRHLVNFSDRTALWDGWRFTGTYNHVSDSSYLYDYGNAMSHSPIYNLRSGAAISGGGKWWNASFGATTYQNTNPFATDSSLPYRQLPYALFSMEAPLTRRLQAGVDTSAVMFRKAGYVEGQREDLYPYLTADFGNAAWFVRPRLAWRYTAYQLNDGYQNYGRYGRLGSTAVSPFTEKSPSRSLPIVSLDSGLMFDRGTSLFGTHYTQTLEPRLYYLYVPYRNQDNLPLFDTNLMSFDYWQLFSTNQFSGADRQMDANNVTAALTTRLLDDDGVERLSASIGQIRYLSRQRVLGTDWTGSAYVAQLDLQLNDRWRVNSSWQWSPNSRAVEVATFGLQRRLGDAGIVNLAYHYRRGRLEQYSASAVYPLSDKWRLFGAWAFAPAIDSAYKLPSGTVDAMFGVEYDSCCVTLRLVDRNYVNQSYYGNTPPPSGTNVNRRDNAIMFEIVFKGLGSTGGQIEPLLRRDILDYQ